MRDNLITRIISYFVVLAGVSVMAGWIFDIGFLKSILPFWVSMKFTTAMCFVASGVTLLSIREYFLKKTFYHQIVLPVTCLVIFLLMLTMLIGALFNINTGIESFFINEGESPLMTNVPGQPSLGTMLAFLLIGMTGVLTEFKVKRLIQKLKKIGWMTVIIGLTALAGYLANVPVFYYHLEGVSTAMAVHTAVLFILLGIGYLCLKESEKQ